MMPAKEKTPTTADVFEKKLAGFDGAEVLLGISSVPVIEG